jgi:hypothetical protein
LLVRQRRDKSPFILYDKTLWLLRGVDRSGRNDFVYGHALWQERYADGIALSGSD